MLARTEVRIKHLNKSALCKIAQNRSAIPRTIKRKRTPRLFGVAFKQPVCGASLRRATKAFMARQVWNCIDIPTKLWRTL
jgi:hypothetical protein